MSGAWLVLFLAMWLVCIVLAILVLGLSRRVQWLESTVPERGAGAASDLRERLLGKRFAEHAVDSGVVGAAGGMAGVVLFVSKHCGPCQTLASDLAAKLDKSNGKGLAQALDARVTIITDQPGMFDGLGATAVIVDPDGGVRTGFDVTATPTGIALDEEGVVREALIANHFRDVEKLARVAEPGELNVAVSA